MISRTGPCPCGSAKQYKRCCGKEQSKTGGNYNPLNLYNTIDIIQTIAALTLIPSNHGKNIRLEKIAREAVVNQNKSNKKIPADKLAQFLKSQYAADPEEDSPGNLFTEVVAFHGGDHLILPGIIESPAFILNNLLSAIFNWPDANLPKRFKNSVAHTAHALLLISDAMLRKAGFHRYMYGNKNAMPINFPTSDKLNELKKAVCFLHSEIEDLFEQFGIDKRCLDQFISDLKADSFKDRNVEESPLIEKPFIITNDGLLVASPATLCHALILAIKSLSHQWNCEDRMHAVYHSLVWNNTKLNLKRLKFVPVEIPSVSFPINDHVQTFLGSFDDDKIALIQYLAISQPSNTPPLDKLIKIREDIIAQIAKTPGYEEYQFIDITLPSALSNDIMMPIKGTAGSHTLVINICDLDIATRSKKCSALNLWKFAIAREEQIPRPLKFMGLSFLDEYTAYKKHNDSFYLSDEGFDMSEWMYGQSQSFIETAKLREDEHCMTIRVNNHLAKTTLIRRDKYSPIYLSLMDLSAHELQFAIEDLGPSVWVKPILQKGISTEANHIFWEFTDAISYWLWQLTGDIKPLLLSIDPDHICFNFELDDIAKFESPDENFTRHKIVYERLKVSSSGDVIQLTFPFEIMAYFYGGDNEGDRIIVRHLLYGINDALVKKKFDPLSEERITEIIEKNAPLGLKKKLFVIHSRSNLLLDRRNLKATRYIKDYDVSKISSSITKLLADKCPPIGEVADINEKKQLTKNIVIFGLLPLLKKTISEYNSEQLIKRLIALNESLISEREHLKLKTPTRIACFVSQSQHTEDLMETMGDISRTTIALRCLLEHLAAEQSKGIKCISTTAIDELIAIMDAIVSWGSTGDQLTFHLFDIRLGVLKTGRIATQKIISREIFDPYYHSKTKETIQDAIEGFEQEFPREDTEKTGKEVPPYLDKAFKEEFNITFSRICTFIDILVDQAFQQETPYAVMDKKSLLGVAKKYHEPFEEDEFNYCLDFLGLTNRGDVKNIPKHYEGYDISPWRFNRRLSLMRRPLIIYETDDSTNPLIYWGARQTLVSRISLAEQCLTDRLKVNDKGLVKKAMSRLTAERGTGLVLSVLNGFKLSNVVLDSEVYISPKGKLKHSSDIGDIDVLLIDLEDKTLYSLECKNFAPTRNIKEMIEECEKLMGSPSKKGLIERHSIRDVWIKNNLKQIGLLYKQDLSGFAVQSLMVTREGMLFPYLKNAKSIRMPFITIYELTTEGLKCLKKQD